MKPTSKYLRAAAAAYLRYRRRCPIVVFERGLTYLDHPDVLGVTKDRHTVEIEIKTSLADFKADGKKRKWMGLLSLDQKFRQFYYMVPPELVADVEPLLSEGKGLMTLADTSVYGLREAIVKKPAKVDQNATGLKLRELIKMVWHQSGTLCSLAKEVVEADETVDPK